MYAMVKFIEIVAAVFSSVLYVHFAAFRYDVDYHWDEDIDHIISKTPNHFEDKESIRVHNIQQIVFESFFFIIMILNFFVEYQDLENNQIVRSFGKIANNYIFKGTFAFDLLSLIPWNWLVHFKGSRYLFLIKTYRIFVSFELLDP